MGLDKYAKDKVLVILNQMTENRFSASAERPVLRRKARTGNEPQRGDLFRFKKIFAI
jgi:hypothetical protein